MYNISMDFIIYYIRYCWKTVRDICIKLISSYQIAEKIENFYINEDSSIEWDVLYIIFCILVKDDKRTKK